MNMPEFPVERIWRMLYDFAPRHKLKFRRTQFELIADKSVAVRVHFHDGRELPF